MTARTPKLRAAEFGQEKLCTKCDEWWPADTEFFYADPSGAAGLFYCCKACYVEAFGSSRVRTQRAAERAAKAVAA